MKHGSLFSGIGGPDLAAEWMGWENVMHCEINPFGRKILNYYWPNAISYEDITKTDFTIHRGTIDILTGGFPCQPYSQAGKRLGKEDNRHLWPEMLRAIREIAPSYIVGENVYGLVNWNEGMVFDEVQLDLEDEGYEVWPVILPAASVNAPHRRDRVWFVAYRNDRNRAEIRFQTRREIHLDGDDGSGFSSNSTSSGRKERQQTKGRENSAKIRAGMEFRSERSCEDEFSANANNNGSHGSENRQSNTERNDSNQTRSNAVEQPSGCCSERIFANPRCSERENWIYGEKQRRKAKELGDSYTKFGQFSKFPTTKPTICSGDDGLPSGLDGITFSKWRNESIKAYGNAIVPQVIYQIFKAIQKFNNQINQ